MSLKRQRLKSDAVPSVFSRKHKQERISSAFEKRRRKEVVEQLLQDSISQQIKESAFSADGIVLKPKGDSCREEEREYRQLALMETVQKEWREEKIDLQPPEGLQHVSSGAGSCTPCPEAQAHVAAQTSIFCCSRGMCALSHISMTRGTFNQIEKYICEKSGQFIN